MNALIPREPLRVAVRRVLIERLLSGELEPGSDINEKELCEDLGVSRTPVRQALLHLEFEGFLDSQQGKGFSVLPLRGGVAAELYPLVGALEALALRWSAPLEEEVGRELRALNQRRASLDRHQYEERIELDDQWHDLLLSGCENGQLLGVLRLLKNRLYRYEHAIAEGTDRLGDSTSEHRAIREAFEAGDTEEAARLLEEHWRIGVRSASSVLDGHTDGRGPDGVGRNS